jgi:type 1 glutamine amidotransferase
MAHLPTPKQNCCLLIVSVVFFCHVQMHAAEPVLRVLVFSGQNNHNWRATTPKLKTILESSRQFAVDVTEHPEQCDAEMLQRYDVLLSNWNTFGKPAVTNWPTAMRAAFLDFVRGGKGFVSVHAGSSSFYDWPEYQQLVGGSWKPGQTGHGPPHDFTVKLADANHPATIGLTNFSTTDELWHRTALQTNIEILATAYSAPEFKGTGKDEPIAFTTRFGQGRCFNLLLGHDMKTMDAAGFQKLLCCGTEWAAIGTVSGEKKSVAIRDEKREAK